jgi:hypothetical protein
MLQSQVHRLSSKFGFGSPESGFIVYFGGQQVEYVALLQTDGNNPRSHGIIILCCEIRRVVLRRSLRRYKVHSKSTRPPH